MLSMLLYFVLALLLLVTVHEYGHFLVARACGVKVLRFSFGFGKVLARWHDKRGTEYTWSLVPLGGYVKMLDETENDVPEHERHMAFNNKPVWARMAIVLAGPLFNFIFAFVALWLVLIIGIKSLAPIIDSVKSGSIAARAGLMAKQEILSLNGHSMASWHDVYYEMTLLSGTHGPVAITAKALKGGQQTTHILSLVTWVVDENKQSMLASLGFVPFMPTIPPIIGEVIPKSPAQIAGLQPGDMVTSIDRYAVDNWLKLVDVVRLHPSQDVMLHIDRNGRPENIAIHTGSVTNEGRQEGYLGVLSQDPARFLAPWLLLQRETPLPAIKTAFLQTVDLTRATVMLMGRLMTGEVSWHSISGPVGIAQGARESASQGLPYYLFFLALVSVSLGVLNLLPIPMLDGGHLLYYWIEIIFRRPVSNAVKSVGIYIGMGLLVMLMIVALHNDITRLAG